MGWRAATVEPLGPTATIAADLRLAFEINVVAAAALTAGVLPGSTGTTPRAA